MQDTELYFPSLKNLIAFKQQSQVKDLRIDTYQKSLTGQFPESEVMLAIRTYKAKDFSGRQVTTT